MSTVPSLSDVEALKCTLQEVARQIMLEEDRARVTTLKTWVKESWSSHLKAVYQWLRCDDWGALTLLQRPNGTLTGNILEMDTLLHKERDPS